ncbi:mucin-5AC-like isoform X2 [Haliotis rufescens]|uniref:mucin-5AC-like isoform X2 n=1 Tax=Haliotis rufescens TaxID=6454 RepID=UPI00201F1C03|nr:mucin-5AC-like isoform X2 [Haliotis rufescens]
MGTGNRDLFGRDQFSSSTSFDYSFEADRGRLDTAKEGNLAGAWMPRMNDKEQWIQVDLKHPEFITGVVTQGRPSMDHWVTKYTVLTSIDGIDFTPYTRSGETATVVFTGNSDRNTQVRGLFDREIIARYVRIQPQEWNGMIALRFDILSCSGLTSGPATIAPPGVSGSPTAVPPGVSGSPTAVPPGVSGSPTAVPPGVSGSPTAVPPGVSGSPTAVPPGVSGSPTPSPKAGISGIPTPKTGISGSPTAVPPGVSGSPTAVPPGVSGSPTAFPPGVSGSPTPSPKAGISGIPTPKTGISGSPTAVPPGVSGSPTAVPPGVSGSPTAVPPGVSGSPTAVPPGVSGSPTAVPPGVSRSQTAVPPGVSGSATAVPPGVSGSPTASPKTGISGSPTAIPPGVSGSPTAVPPGVSGSPTAVPPGISGIPTARPPGVSGSPTASPKTGISGSPTAIPPGVSGSPTAVPPGVSGSPTAVPPGISGSPTARPPGVSGSPTAVPPGVSGSPTAVPPGVSGSPTAVPPGVSESPTAVPPGVSGSPTAVPPGVSGSPTASPKTGISGSPTAIPPGVSGSPTAVPPGVSGSPTAVPPGVSSGVVCSQPMGIDNALTVKDNQITASGFSGNRFTAPAGRLFNEFGAWSPKVNNGDQWIMVNFLKPQVINGILTQGSPISDKWVTQFIVSYSTDGFTFIPIKDSATGKSMIFTGNSDRNTIMKNIFPQQVTVQYIKITPVAWSPAGIGMRFNMLGCYKPSITPTATPTAKPTVAPEFTVTTGVTMPEPSPVSTLEPVCTVPMGVENYRIVGESQLTASSEKDKAHGSIYARIYQGMDEFSGSWVPAPTDKTPWIQVDFLEPKTISGVITQGSGKDNGWVETYTVRYSFDGKTFTDYTGTGGKPAKVFNGNSDSKTPVPVLFNRDIIARFVRIVPVTSHGVTSLRFNILGCNPSPANPLIPTTAGPGTPTASPPLGGQSGVPTASPPTSSCKTSHWSPWINKDTPDTGKGDYEKITPEQQQQYCSGGKLTKIDCQTVDDIEYFSSGEVMKCLLTTGSTCNNADNMPIPCSDYKIRYFCECLAPTASPVPGQSSQPTASPGIEQSLLPTASPVPEVTTQSVCLIPMGIENSYFVSNSQLTSSSSLDAKHSASVGRLYNTKGAWSPSSNEKQWLQVNFLKPTLISGVMTQGSPEAPKWVTKYNVFLGFNGNDFFPYTTIPGESTPAIFEGNMDKSTPIRNLFNRDITAQYVRIVPVEWSKDGIAMRFNILGCTPPEPKPQTPVPGVPTASPPSGQSTPGPFLKCDVPMGIQNPGLIGDRQLTASSSLNEFTGAERARPYTQKDGSYSGGWIPKYTDTKQWIEVDFGASYAIAGVSTQGRSDGATWVTKYEVYYSNDGRTFNAIYPAPTDTVPRVFEGNFDRNTPLMNVFAEINARFIRIRPVEWHEAIGMRFNVYGCQLPSATPSVPTGLTVPTAIPTAIPTAGPTVGPVFTTAPSTSSCMYWTPWVNSNTPDTNGEYESFWDMMTSVKICDTKYVKKMECRTAAAKIPFDQTGETGVMCNLDTKSLVCMNTDQKGGKTCSDYEIRVFCDECSKPTAAPSANPSIPTAVPKTCDNKWSDWINRHEPDAVGETEKVTKEDLDRHCAGGSVGEVECDTVSDNMAYYLSGDIVKCDAQTGLSCKHSDNTPMKCHDYKLRFKCKCESTPTAKPPTSGTEVPSVAGCTTSQWSSWINQDKPGVGGGDYEKITPELQKQYCSGGTLTKIECMTVDGIEYYSSGEVMQCTMAGGFTCNNADNFPMPCSDYKIRYFCDCTTPVTTGAPGIGGSGTPTASPGIGGSVTPTASPGIGGSGKPTASPAIAGSGTPTASPGIGGSGTPTASPGIGGSGTPTASPGIGGSGKPTASPGIGGSGTPTTSPGIGGSGTPTASPGIGGSGTPTASPGIQGSGTPTASENQCTNSRWSSWINRDNPNVGDGDYESMTSDELTKLCPGGKITEVKCETVDDIPSYSSGEIMTCDKNQGVICRNEDNFPMPCSDYKIMYYCQCAPTASPPTGTAGTPTASPIVGQSGLPTATPGVTGKSGVPTASPSAGQSGLPTASPGVTVKSGVPSTSPSAGQTGLPTATPGIGQTGGLPTAMPVVTGKSGVPTASPSAGQSGLPTASPGVTGLSGQPTASPSAGLSRQPTAVPTVTSCSQSHFSNWVNRDLPESGNGDHEFMTPDELSSFCKGGQITKIECYTNDIPSYSSGELLTCDLKNGLTCNNADNAPVPCSDYKVRYFCDCSGTPQVTLTPPNKMLAIRCDWSPWINIDTPDSGHGDMETIDSIKTKHGVCKNMKQIECRIAGTNTMSSAAGQSRVTCDVDNGLRCYNNEQLSSKCYDYEVRVLCWEDTCKGPIPTAGPTGAPHIHTTGVVHVSTHVTGSSYIHTTVAPLERTTTAVCPPGEMWNACAHTCDQLCNAVSGDICDGTNPQQCVPGCKDETITVPKCADGERLNYNGQCLKAELCPCKKPDGTIAKPFEFYKNPLDECSMCHCFNNAEACTKDESCVPTAGPSVQPTIQPECHWTNWINVDKPTTGDGDIESILKLRTTNSFCAHPLSIECREVSTKTTAMEYGQKVSCDLTTGFTCYNWENSGKCGDYEVRFYCPCASTVSPSTRPSGLPTASPSGQSGLPTASPSGQSGQPTASPSGQTGQPTASPSGQSGQPTASPSGQTGQPTASPSGQSGQPTASPSGQTGQPTASPSGQSGQPTASPSGQSGQPTASPSGQTGHPTASPSGQSGQPTASPSGQTGQPTASPSGQSGQPTVSPPFCGWSAWTNSDHPDVIVPNKPFEGDIESIASLMTKTTVCSHDMMKRVECRVAGTKQMASAAGQSITCDAIRGLRCNNLKQIDGKCLDYEMRVFCDCSTLPTAQPSIGPSSLPTASPSAGQSGVPTASPGVTGKSGQPTASPSAGQSGLPTASPSVTGKSGQPTASPSAGQSSLPTASPGVTGKSGVPTASPSAGQSGLPTITPGIGQTGLPTAVPTVCGWTKWMNSNTPDNTGEMELLANLRQQFQFCHTEDITALECRDSNTHKSASESGQVGVTCDMKYSGLMCSNNKQMVGGTCFDYEVRVLCEPKGVDCSKVPTAIPTVGQSGLPTASPVVGQTGLPTGTPSILGQPSISPSAAQSGLPTASPSAGQSGLPGVTGKSSQPTASPSAGQSGVPTASPGVTGKSGQPTASPSAGQSGQPTVSPGVTGKSGVPTASPSAGQSGLPTASPGVTGKSSVPTASPSAGQSGQPTATPVIGESGQPTAGPPGVTGKSGQPTASPSAGQSGLPTAGPPGVVGKSGVPTATPGVTGKSGIPTASPSAGQSGQPTASPGIGESGQPTAGPPGVTGKSGVPTASPSAGQSGLPTATPGVTGKSGIPTASPSAGQSGLPTAIPGVTQKSGQPTASPSAGQSGQPTATPGLGESGQPTASPSAGQSGQPTASPGVTGTSGVPTASPVAGQSGLPTAGPPGVTGGKSGQPTASPSAGQSGLPTASPVFGSSSSVAPGMQTTAVVGQTTTPVLICPNPMTNTAALEVPDNHLSASSSLSEYAGPQRSNIDAVSDKVNIGAWMPKTMDKGQWIEARFDHPEYINAIITKGREGSSQWVKAFMIAYSIDGKTFQYYEKSAGSPKIFNGNFDGDSAVRTVLTPIVARYIRIQPVIWEGAIALRFSIIGCRAPEEVLPTLVPSAGPTAAPQQSCVTSTWSAWVNTNRATDGQHEFMTEQQLTEFCPSGKVDKVECETVDKIPSYSTGEIVQCTVEKGLVCKDGDNAPIPCSDYRVRYHCDCSGVPTASPGQTGSGLPTASPGQAVSGTPTASPGVQLTASPTPNIPAGCREEMGMANGIIRNDMISASSYRDGLHSAISARLGGNSAWLAATENKNQYIQVDFLAPRIITGVTTQGRPTAPSYVTSYKVFYSYDGANWNAYRETKGEDMMFSGNFDNLTPVTNTFMTPIRARYIRISPQTWSGMIALRFEIHGCFESYPTMSPTPVNPLKPTASPLPGSSSTAVPPQVQTVTPFLPAGCVTWDKWIDLGHVTLTSNGDREPIEEVKKASLTCQQPMSIECRTATPDHTASGETGQKVTCNLWEGLVCNNADQKEPMCFNYEVRLGCLKQTPECLSKIPTATPTAGPSVSPPINVIPCYTGMDLSQCPKEGCSNGYYCDGVQCVKKAECPCMIDGQVVLPGQISQNSNCDTCQCVHGEVKCLPKTCSPCKEGLSTVLDKDTCECECETCAIGDFRCGNGQCIPHSARCDGVADCTTDEFECMSTPIFTLPSTHPPSPTMPGTAAPTLTTSHFNDIITPSVKIVTTGIVPNTTVHLPPHVPTPTACVDVKCSPLVQPPLNQGEVAKVIKSPDGCCEEYLVVCEPRQCPTISKDCMKPEVLTMVDSGERCCPEYTCVCPPKCPVPAQPPCAFGSQVVDIFGGCNCTTKACVAGTTSPFPVVTTAVTIPVCTYSMTKVVTNGKEVDRPRPVEVTHTVGQQWADGLCKTCQCVNTTSGTAETTCHEQQCPACKLGEERRTTDGTCCGECMKTGCVDSGKVYKQGEKIPSSMKCFEKMCTVDIMTGDFILQQTQIQCESIDKLPVCTGSEKAYDSTGCCLRCVPTDMVPTNSSNSVCQSCTPRLMFGQVQQSIGFFKVNDEGEVCSNVEPIPELKECAGYCGSTSSYTSLMRGFDNKCLCCQPAKTVAKSVQLVCGTGRKITKTYNVPETCGCSACSNGA